MGEKRNNNKREQRYLLENIFYKNTRENTTNTNLPRNWIAPVTMVKNRALESFIFFREIVGPRKSPRVIFGPPRKSLGYRISIPDYSFFSPIVLIRSSISIIPIRVIILERVDGNSACQRQFFPREGSNFGDLMAERTNTTQLTHLKMNLRLSG